MSEHELAADIRRHVVDNGVSEDLAPTGLWWYDGGREGELPEALAADLIAAGWHKTEPETDQ